MVESRRKLRTKAGWITGAAVMAAATWAVVDYRRWRSLGPGGLPANLGGWLTTTRFRMIAKGELDVSPLAPGVGSGADLRAWHGVCRRSGLAPKVSPYPVPHRQLDQLPEDGVRVELKRMFDDAVTCHADEVGYVLSHFEKRHPAITLRDSAGRVGAGSHGEIAHIHPSDNSMHMVLSPTDAIAAIEAGWARRHGLAGLVLDLPMTYVMVYAPRNAADLAVVGELLEAAIAYAVQRGS
jgi:hypothetical protein